MLYRNVEVVLRARWLLDARNRVNAREVRTGKRGNPEGKKLRRRLESRPCEERAVGVRSGEEPAVRPRPCLYIIRRDL